VLDSLAVYPIENLKLSCTCVVSKCGLIFDLHMNPFMWVICFLKQQFSPGLFALLNELIFSDCCHGTQLDTFITRTIPKSASQIDLNPLYVEFSSSVDHLDSNLSVDTLTEIVNLVKTSASLTEINVRGTLASDSVSHH